MNVLSCLLGLIAKHVRIREMVVPDVSLSEVDGKQIHSFCFSFCYFIYFGFLKPLPYYLRSQTDPLCHFHPFAFFWLSNSFVESGMCDSIYKIY